MFNRLADMIERMAMNEASSRPVALVRIILTLLILVKYGESVAFFNADIGGMEIISPIFFLLAAMMLFGFQTKVAVLGMTLLTGMFYFFFGQIIGVHEWTHHHAYVLFFVTAMLNGAPCEKSFSVDRYLALRDAARDGEPAPAERGPQWAQKLIVLQMAALYFWTAVDKTEWHFLNGDRLERIFEWAYAGHPFYEMMTIKPVLAALSVIVVIVEYALAVSVALGIWKRATLVVAIGLHVAFYFMLKVDTYSATMIALYLLYVNPDRLHRGIDVMLGHAPATPSAPIPAPVGAEPAK